MALTTRPGPDPGPTPTKIPDTQPNPGNGGQNNPPGNGGQNDTPGGGDPNQGGGNNSGNNNPPNSDSGGNGGGGPQPGTGPITTWSPVTTVHIPGSPSGIPITVLPSGDGVIIDGHTLHPSNPAVTLPGGHVISASGNGVVVVDGSSITLGSGNNPGVGVNVISRGLNGEVQQAEITISGQTITMKPGEQSTVTGADGIATTVGLDPAGDVILSSSDGSGVLAPVTTTPGGDGSAVQTTGSSVRLEAGFPRVLGLLLTIVYIIA